MAEEVNEKGPGKVIVLAAADVDRVFEADLGFFAETMSGIDGLIDILEQDNEQHKLRSPKPYSTWSVVPETH